MINNNNNNNNANNNNNNNNNDNNNNNNKNNRPPFLGTSLVPSGSKEAGRAVNPRSISVVYSPRQLP